MNANKINSLTYQNQGDAKKEIKVETKKEDEVIDKEKIKELLIEDSNHEIQLNQVKIKEKVILEEEKVTIPVENKEKTSQVPSSFKKGTEQDEVVEKSKKPIECQKKEESAKKLNEVIYRFIFYRLCLVQKLHVLKMNNRARKVKEKLFIL